MACRSRQPKRKNCILKYLRNIFSRKPKKLKEHSPKRLTFKPSVEPITEPFKAFAISPTPDDRMTSFVLILSGAGEKESTTDKVAVMKVSLKKASFQDTQNSLIGQEPSIDIKSVQ